MRTNRSTSLTAVLLLVAALVVGSCSSGGDEKGDKEKTTTTKAASEGGDSSTTEDDDSEETTTTKGDDDDEVEVSGDGQPFVDAMVDAMMAEEDMPFSEDQARCVAARTVDTIGVDRLTEAGVTPDQFGSSGDNSMDFSELGLTEDDANEIFDNFGKCDINFRELMLESMAADSEVTPEMKGCMEAVLTDENLRRLMVATFMSGDEGIDEDPALADLMGGIMGCAFMGMGEGMDSGSGMGEDTTAPTTSAAG